MKNISKLYTRYVIKSSFLFYGFLLTGILLFSLMTFGIELDAKESYEGLVKGNNILISEEVITPSDHLFLYSDKNEAVSRIKIEEISYRTGVVLYTVADESVTDFQGEVTVELITGKETLFKRIFMRAGRG